MTGMLVRELRPLAGVTMSLMVLTVVAYPLVVTGVAQLAFNRQANGSLIEVDGQAVGSSLVGQVFMGAAYFQGRPSAAGMGYDGASSSGSNYGPLSQKLNDRVATDAAAFREAHGLDVHAELPSDAVTASASGLDPHVSPATARLQVASVATARGTSEVNIRALLDEYTEGRALGLIGEPRVNVLKLNIALDERYPLKP